MFRYIYKSVWNGVCGTTHTASQMFKQSISMGLAVGLGVIGVSPIALANDQTTPVSAETAVSDLTARQAMPNGIYLYGQATEPDQIGSAYMVFEVSGQQVVGAFYMPQSSFDCFSGAFQGEQLALNVVDSYEQTVYPYAMALDANANVASATGAGEVTVGIEGFHPIATLSEMDQNILNTCRSDLGTP